MSVWALGHQQRFSAIHEEAFNGQARVHAKASFRHEQDLPESHITAELEFRPFDRHLCLG